jgi:hypothetical protein
MTLKCRENEAKVVQAKKKAGNTTGNLFCLPTWSKYSKHEGR